MHDMLNPFTMVAVYMTIWWVVVFAILPLGNRSHAEMGIDLKDGGDPGAPVNPNLARKAITTSWVSALIFVAVYALMFSGIIPTPDLASFGQPH
jgi:predicted secreted protein